MITTIQVQKETLELLKKIKEETKTSSYDETIKKIVIDRNKKESFAGYLGKHFGKKSREWVLKDLRDKNDRF